MEIDELMNRSGYESEELTEDEWLIVQKFDEECKTYPERNFTPIDNWLDGLWFDNYKDYNNCIKLWSANKDE